MGYKNLIVYLCIYRVDNKGCDAKAENFELIFLSLKEQLYGE